MYQNTTRGMVMLVSEIMSGCRECTEDTPVEKVYELIQKCDQGSVVVIDSERHRVPLGIVTGHSICEQIVAKSRSIRGLTAGDVLDWRIKKIPETAAAEECARFIDGSWPAAGVAVDARGRLRGLVSPAEVASMALAADGTGLAIAQSPAVKKASRVTGIPASGWVQ